MSRALSVANIVVPRPTLANMTVLCALLYCLDDAAYNVELFHSSSDIADPYATVVDTYKERLATLMKILNAPKGEDVPGTDFTGLQFNVQQSTVETKFKALITLFRQHQAWLQDQSVRKDTGGFNELRTAANDAYKFMETMIDGMEMVYTGKRGRPRVSRCWHAVVWNRVWSAAAILPLQCLIVLDAPLSNAEESRTSREGEEPANEGQAPRSFRAGLCCEAARREADSSRRICTSAGCFRHGCERGVDECGVYVLQ